MQAIIMAGGKGTRMRPITDIVPKLLIPINKKPFIDHIFDHLKKNGFDNIIICTGYLGDKIKKHLKGKNYGLTIRQSMEKQPLGTGGALHVISSLLEDDFLLLYGDIYTTINVRKMFQFHKKKKAVVTAAIHPSSHPEDSNLIEFNSHERIIKILKKPHGEIPKKPYNLAAVYFVSSSITKHFLKEAPYDFERDLLSKLLDENVPIYGYNTPEFMMDIGTPERLAKVENLLQ